MIFDAVKRPGNQFFRVCIFHGSKICPDDIQTLVFFDVQKELPLIKLPEYALRQRIRCIGDFPGGAKLFIRKIAKAAGRRVFLWKLLHGKENHILETLHKFPVGAGKRKSSGYAFSVGTDAEFRRRKLKGIRPRVVCVILPDFRRKNALRGKNASGSFHCFQRIRFFFSVVFHNRLPLYFFIRIAVIL